MEERLQLKPSNIKCMIEWKKFIKLKTSSEFKALSEKNKAIRQRQLPHTCSHRGMARLAEDLKSESGDRSSMPRSEVWIKSRTKKNGEPVNLIAAEAIEKIKQIESISQSSSPINYRADALAQVLGQERPGQLRAMGRGMSLSRAALSEVKDKHTLQLENKLLNLENRFLQLEKNQKGDKSRHSGTEVNKPLCNFDKNMKKCDLLDWRGNEEIVAEGRFVSDDPNEIVNDVPLGPDAMIVLVDCPIKLDAFLWRPTPSFILIGEAKDNIMAWPKNRVVLNSTDHIEEEEDKSRNSSLVCKCKIFDWGGSKQLVALGRLHSSISEEIVNDVPLRPSAMIVWIDLPVNEEAFLWRPAPGLIRIADAVGKKVAWPKSQVVVEMVDTTAPITYMDMVKTFMTANSRTKTTSKCKLLDFKKWESSCFRTGGVNRSKCKGAFQTTRTQCS